MGDPVLKELNRGCGDLSRGCAGGAASILPTDVFISIAFGFRAVGSFFGSLFG
jgi:hypothetical protein